MNKKMVGIITYIIGVWIWIINLFIGVSCTLLFIADELTIKEYILSIIYILGTGIVYHFVFLYTFKQKVYTCENGKNIVVFYTYKNKYVINKKDIVKQTPHILTLSRLHWKVIVKTENKKQIFFVDNKV